VRIAHEKRDQYPIQAGYHPTSDSKDSPNKKDSGKNEGVQCKRRLDVVTKLDKFTPPRKAYHSIA